MINTGQENHWSPFDPQWYESAFDTFISTADQLFNTDELIKSDYNIPDADRSRSTAFRNAAILNNSFSEYDLRESLKDIYLNSTHKLKASNHDNTHFYQWHGYMSDMSISENTNVCQFKVPIDSFIGPGERDIFKQSQMYRKWIKPEDILNNWNIFKFHCLVFINQRVYSEYELRIDDREVTIRFAYNDYWLKNNFPVYIYKFDTTVQSRVLITRELCQNQWNWKVPLDFINNKRLLNVSNVMVSFNKISDQSIRKDGLTQIEVLGDNLEFLTIEDGYIDISNISSFNKIYIQSEATEYLWMSIFAPKFINEYPIPLPVDVIYRPYEANFQKISVYDDAEGLRLTKADIIDNDTHQLYIDLKGSIKENENGWNQMIRPIVLSDAYVDYVEPGIEIVDLANDVVKLSTESANLLEEFRFDKSDSYKLDKYLNDILISFTTLKDKFYELMDALQVDHDNFFEDRFDKVLKVVDEIRDIGTGSSWLTAKESNDNNFFILISPLVYIPRELASKYEINTVLSDPDGIKMWHTNEDHVNKLRFQRPIDSNDFWTFEYSEEEHVYRPYPLSVTHQFPDVYLLNDPDEKIVSANRLFRALFFYSDTMSVTNIFSDKVDPTPSWDNDMREYMYDRGAVYRDIFMEKFYWMGIGSIYKGLLKSSTRWEMLEYLINNESYERFNSLFLMAMDPYFKLGLATYLRSSNYQFPFDDAINKMQEVMSQDFIGYKKVTNFEIYLNKNWIPSYFDYITAVMNEWVYSERLVHRPRSTFDINKVLPVLITLQNDVYAATKSIQEDTDWIYSELLKHPYGLSLEYIYNLRTEAASMNDHVVDIKEFIESLDIDIYSVDDINHIIEGFNTHNSNMENIQLTFSRVYGNAIAKIRYQQKREMIEAIRIKTQRLPSLIDDVANVISSFDMDQFMLAVNDLTTYLDPTKNNPNDISLIGEINKFNTPWRDDIKEYRNALFISTAKFYGMYDKYRSYSMDDTYELNQQVTAVRNDLIKLRAALYDLWRTRQFEPEQTIIDRMDHAETLLGSFSSLIYNVIEYRERLNRELNDIVINLDIVTVELTDPEERKYITDIASACCGIDIAMSYIVGSQMRDNALDHVSSMNAILNEYDAFVNHEEDVFNKIMILTEPPVLSLKTLRSYQDLIDALIKYLDTVNDEYVPYDNWPTYSDVYEVTDVELVNRGLLNGIGDTLYAPLLGAYSISEISDDVIKETLSISMKECRRTSFRDPVDNNRTYDCISSGNGMGVTIKPIQSNHIRIINDQAASQYITICKNTCAKLLAHLDNGNPHDNNDMAPTTKRLNKIISDWQLLLDKYSDYMSISMKNYIDKMCDMIDIMIPLCNDFMNTRSNIKVNDILTYLEDFIFSSYRYIESNEQVNENFSYYDESIREAYNQLFTFFGNGTTWSSTKELKDILEYIKNPIRVYKQSIIDTLEDDDQKNGILDKYDDLMKSIATNIAVLNAIPEHIIMVKPNVNQLLEYLENDTPELHTDVWYRIMNTTVASNGTGYKIGDIIEVVPELPTDMAGNEIHDDEEIIMNDIILFKVVDMDNGSVIKVEPLIEYAVPYLIWGVRQTISRTGSGQGLSIDISSKQIELSDTTLFTNELSDIDVLPPFNETDLFVFKFDNPHRLNIQYEVFLGGKQNRSFHLRRNNDTDLIYINANDVIGLQNTSIFTPAENYFIYKLEKATIDDPGAGYSIGQEVFVDAGDISLKLLVTAVTDDPFKGIAGVELAASNRVIEGNENPVVDHAIVADHTLSNIDDEFHESHYDHLDRDGVIKSIGHHFDIEEYNFESKRYDDLEDGMRNKLFMYPDIENEKGMEGDPDEHIYVGTRYDENLRYNGVMNIINTKDPGVDNKDVFPEAKPFKAEYQSIKRVRLHNSIDESNHDVNKQFNPQEKSVINNSMVEGDLQVEHFADLPRHIREYAEGRVGKCVIVNSDETHDGHRMLYKIRTFVSSGYFVYELPEIADYSWNKIYVDWMNSDYHPDYPTNSAQYPDAHWNKNTTYSNIQHDITDGKIEGKYIPSDVRNTSYIHNVTVDDISVYNHSTNRWEDLNDNTRWKLVVDEENYSFTLELLEDGNYSYDMEIFLDKTPVTQIRNASIKRNAVISLTATIATEVNEPSMNTYINTGHHLRIRKLFPYEQVDSFIIGKDNDGYSLGYTMDVKLHKYDYFRNQIHLEDIKLFNKTANRFENLLDDKLFEIRFKDPAMHNQGYETNTVIERATIGVAGSGFVNGEVWAYNSQFGTSVFGVVSANMVNGGYLMTFTPLHVINPPTETISLEFEVYQGDIQTQSMRGIVVIDFVTERVEAHDDGYIHNVTNRLAPVPDEFQILIKYDLDGPYEYEVCIDMTPKKWTFIEDKWLMSPTFILDGCNIQRDRLYVLTDKGRFPLVNPSTQKPTLSVAESANGTAVTFMNLYRKYEHLEIRSTPYPMRSVYTLRDIPESGFIDVSGKINKPLNKKYFEFWVNGRLLYDEVTIITPTKLILHGLQSLKNFEIVEINRDPNEYFSEGFIDIKESSYDRPYLRWDYTTYLDDVLTGNLAGDNYTIEEQEYLLSPVWRQVPREHPEYKNYPPNVDIEEDILTRANPEDYPLGELDDPTFKFMIVDPPTLEGHPIAERVMPFRYFGFVPFTNEQIVDMLNEEWSEEIKSDPYFNEHVVISDDEWYGIAAMLYDELGIAMPDPSLAKYHVADSNLLRINSGNKTSRIIKNTIEFDLN